MATFQHSLGVHCIKKSGARASATDKEKPPLEKQEMYPEGEICTWLPLLKNVNLGKYKKAQSDNTTERISYSQGNAQGSELVVQPPRCSEVTTGLVQAAEVSSVIHMSLVFQA